MRLGRDELDEPSGLTGSRDVTSARRHYPVHDVDEVVAVVVPGDGVHRDRHGQARLSHVLAVGEHQEAAGGRGTQPVDQRHRCGQRAPEAVGAGPMRLGRGHRGGQPSAA